MSPKALTRIGWADGLKDTRESCWDSICLRSVAPELHEENQNREKAVELLQASAKKLGNKCATMPPDANPSGWNSLT
eukprot:6471988-Amphidinium_carterae.1